MRILPSWRTSLSTTRTAAVLAAFLLAGSMVVSCSLAAQTGTGVIAGRVAERETERPIAGARLSIVGTDLTALTDRTGGYRLEGVPTGTRRVEVDALGFERIALEVVIAAGETASGDFALAPSPFLLDEVVATGTVAPTELRAVPNAIGIVTSARIEARRLTQVEELFRGELPGIFHGVIGASTISNSPTMRLFSRGSTNLVNSEQGSAPKIYIDNVLVTDPGALQTLSPDAIERIEYLPGPQASTIYGSGALNGVMQIDLKKGGGVDSRPRVAATVSAGSIESSFGDAVAQHHHLVSVDGAAGPTTYRLGGSYMRVGQWLPGRTEQRISADGGIRMDLGPVTAELSLRYGTFEFDGFSRPFSAEAVRGGRYGLNNLTDLLGSAWTSGRTDEAVGITIDYAATPWWRHRLTVSRDKRRSTTIQDPEHHTFADTLFSVNELFSEVVTIGYSTSAELPVAGPVRPTFTLGADHTRNELFSSSAQGLLETGFLPPTASSRSDDPTHGFFAQAQAGLWERVYLTAGTRVEDNPNYGPNYGVNIAPRLGATVVQAFGPVTAKLRGAYGVATQAPPPEARNDISATESGVTYLAQAGNADIAPEVNRGGEIGLDIAWGQTATLQITRFRQTAEDLIAAVDALIVDPSIDFFGEPFTYLQTQYLNIGRVRSTGWELQATTNLGHLELRGSFSTADTEVLELVRPEDPRYRVGDAVIGPAQRTGALDVAYVQDRWRVGLHVSYIGPVRLFNNVAAQFDRDFARQRDQVGRTYLPAPYASAAFMTNGYRTMDVNASYDLGDRVTLFTSVFNALDEYRSDAENLNVVPGRRAWLGLRART